MKIDRFTPAYAGNTVLYGLFNGRGGVHPRIRGEYSSTIASLPCDVGSPPHTRGILRPPGVAVIGRRFTPAYAGNTSKRELRAKSLRVHPRIRGEYLRR